ncbi:MAG: helix-turn-helix transcriptional regulator [Clostridia bacterium]|nr:helix-turn-helix transcriptional regulator [Clostridia bacterium]
MSQAEVAKALGIRQSTVAMWENGTNLPRADKLPALSKLYHCPIEKLLGSKRKEGKGA